MYSTKMYSIKKWATKIQGEQNSWVESTEFKVQTTQFRGNNEAFTIHNYRDIFLVMLCSSFHILAYRYYTEIIHTRLPSLEL